MNKPNHVAIIMDGNGRWAKQRGSLRIEGHKKGLETAENIIDCSIKEGIKYLSLFVFSTENWKRPQIEVNMLFALAERYLSQFEKFCKKGVRIVVSGDVAALPKSLAAKIADITKKTEHFDAICVNLCINYGGRKDIAEACKKVVADGEELTEDNISKHLYNAFVPAPDLIIRTGGQKRLSNFMLYQAAYAELYFTDTLWPAFSNTEYTDIIADYSSRTRSFGSVSE